MNFPYDLLNISQPYFILRIQYIDHVTDNKLIICSCYQYYLYDSVNRFVRVSVEEDSPLWAFVLGKDTKKNLRSYP